MCKHVAGLAIRLNYCKSPPAAKQVEIGGKKRRTHQWEEMETDIYDWGLKHPYTCLVYRLKHIDSDDAYSSVQYFKGTAVLCHLEQDIVRSESDFDALLRLYIDKFIDWNSWLYTHGMPSITIDFSIKLERQCQQLADQYSLITNEQLNLLNAN
ncbi:unnamed protein product [Rotaria sp. Silwood1]|nr:unnamed protein product [Rotaria sp. Silwood1]